MKYKKTIVGFVIVLSLLIMGLFVNRSLLIQSSSFEAYQMPQIALNNLEGTANIVNPASYPLTMLTFWTSSCGACKDDLMLLQELKMRQDMQNINIVSVSRDEKLEDITEILAAMNLTGAFEVLRDPDGKISAQFEVYAVPETFLINRQGMVVKRYVGSVASEKNSLIRELQGYIAKK